VVHFLPRLPVLAAMAAVASLAISPAAVPAEAGQLPASARPAATGPAGMSDSAGMRDSGTPFINGDRLVIARIAGQETAVVLSSASGFGGMLLRLGSGGSGYVIPADAFPYLGHGLDPSLFEIGDLATAGSTLPLTISYQGQVPSLPGVTITSAADGIATGYLTATSAQAFGRALLRQYTADHATGAYGTDGMFANGVTIALAGHRTPARQQGTPARPRYVMHTLTVEGTNLAGKPDTGDDVNIYDADNAEIFGYPDFNEGTNFFFDGIAKYSVPAGHFWGIAEFTDMKGNQPVAARFAVLPGFTVSGTTTVRVSERTADSELAFRTPRPSVLMDDSFQLLHGGVAGPVVNFEVLSNDDFPVWISPVATKPATGSVETFSSAMLMSRPGVRPAYQYNVAYQNLSGRIPPQSFTVTPRALATVQARYYSDVTTAGATMPVGLFPAQLTNPPGVTVATNFTVPVQRTEYMSAGGTPLYWFNTFFQSGGALVGGQTDGGQVFRPGQVTADDWNAYPLHTVPNVNPLGAKNFLQVLVSASRSGNTLRLDMSPFDDSNPGHTGGGFAGAVGVNPIHTSYSIHGSYSIAEDGTTIASGSVANYLGDTGGDLYRQVTLRPGTGTVRFVLNATRTGALFPLSTSTSTAWTWRSVPATGTVPAGWVCDWNPSTFKLSGRNCVPQPLLTLEYAVRGLSLSGVAPAGQQAIGITVGHMQLTRGAKITRVVAAASFDGGKTWHPAGVQRAGGGYRATFGAPGGSYVTLRVTADDAAGGQISETITRAYRTGQAATGTFRAACGPVPADEARCMSVYAPQTAVNDAIAAGMPAGPSGWTAKQIEAAYRLPVSENPHQTVALVDALSTPDLASYLGTYRKQFGLPPCTTASGCLRIVNEEGKSGPLPVSGVGYGWAMETTLDVDMVSAACPDCRILVVEASSPSYSDLAAAEDTAVRLGANVVSNSYGGRENGYAFQYARAYDHPGHVIVASSGDFGYTAANFPADLATVTSAGGTELATAGNARGFTERVWNVGPFPRGGASSSGCSAYVQKPSWQHDPHCAMRTVTDVAAVAWNIPVYNADYGGWNTVGGTSVAAPLIAGVYALAGNAAKIGPGYEYAHASALFNITAGNNAWFEPATLACGDDYLCVAKPGYNGPTGLGTPDGTGAF
jgi:hypothetical protein